MKTAIILLAMCAGVLIGDRMLVAKYRRMFEAGLGQITEQSVRLDQANQTISRMQDALMDCQSNQVVTNVTIEVTLNLDTRTTNGAAYLTNLPEGLFTNIPFIEVPYDPPTLSPSWQKLNRANRQNL